MKAHVPVQLMRRNSKAKILDNGILPGPDDAVRQYRLNGGSITDPEQSIRDPLCTDTVKMNIHFQSFKKRYPSFDHIFHSVVNGNKTFFIDALKYFINITFRLSQ